MELRHLTYFSTVAELGSVSKAAAALHITQPSLSRQIADLERELRHKLFDRTSRGVVLTPAGAGLHSHLEVLFSQVERIPEILRTFSQQKELVRVGLPPGLPHPWFLNVLRQAETAIPQASISLQEASSDEQRQMLRHGLLDVGLMHLDPPEFPSVRVLTQEIGVAVPPQSPLVGMASVQFAHLEGQKVMAHASGEIASEEARLRSASIAAGVWTDWVFRGFSQHSELIAVSTGVDAALMTHASAARHLPSWSWIPLLERDASGRALAVETWAAWSKGSRGLIYELAEIIRTTPAS